MSNVIPIRPGVENEPPGFRNSGLPNGGVPDIAPILNMIGIVERHESDIDSAWSTLQAVIAGSCGLPQKVEPSGRYLLRETSFEYQPNDGSKPRTATTRLYGILDPSRSVNGVNRALARARRAANGDDMVYARRMVRQVEHMLPPATIAYETVTDTGAGVPEAASYRRPVIGEEPLVLQDSLEAMVGRGEAPKAWSIVGRFATQTTLRASAMLSLASSLQNDAQQKR